jgi:hypothetical protein
MNARALLDRAERLTGLNLSQLAAELGLKEATLYKAKLGHIPLSATAAKSLEHLLSRSASAAAAPDATASALRSANGGDPLAEQLAYLRAHASEEERELLADVIGSLHRRVASREARENRKKK